MAANTSRTKTTPAVQDTREIFLAFKKMPNNRPIYRRALASVYKTVHEQLVGLSLKASFRPYFAICKYVFGAPRIDLRSDRKMHF